MKLSSRFDKRIKYFIIDMNDEIFIPVEIDGHVTKYSVSNYGNVINTKRGNYIKPHFDGKYYTARLTINNVTKGFKVHRLVAMSFIPNPEGKAEVNHIDGNKANNKVSNLEWTTPSENCRHAALTGLKPKTVKLSTLQVIQICELYNDGLNSTQISKIVGVNKHTVKNIKNGYAWKELSEKYLHV